MIDLVLGDASGQVRYFRNVGSPAAASFEEITGPANPFEAATVGDPSAPYLFDFDGDGDLDLFVGLAWGNPSVFRNVGTVNAPDFVSMPGGFFPYGTVENDSRIAVADLDGDGFLEVVLGEEAGTLRFLRSTVALPGDPVFAEVVEGNPLSAPRVGLGHVAPAFGDFDGDGDLDAVVGDAVGQLLYFVNTSRSQPRFVQATGSTNPFLGALPAGLFLSNVVVFDFDGDGDLDVFVGVTGGPRYLLNIGTPTAPEFVDVTGTAADPLAAVSIWGQPSVADVDGDGDPDLVLGGGNGQVFLLRNTGSATEPIYVEVASSENPFAFIQAGSNTTVYPTLSDFDGDGDLDLLLSVESLLYFRNEGSSQVPQYVEVAPSESPFVGVPWRHSRVIAVDVDRDGDIDLVGGAYGSTISFLESFENDLFRDGFDCGHTGAWTTSIP